MNIKINGVKTLKDLEAACGAYCYENKMMWFYFVYINGQWMRIESVEEEEEYYLYDREIYEIHVFDDGWNIFLAD